MKKTQKEVIIEYIKKNGSATVRELFALGINSPTKAISEINEKTGLTGHKIIKTMEEVKTRWTHKTRIARYFLIENKPKKKNRNKK